MDLNFDFSSVLAWFKKFGVPYPARDWLVVVILGTLVLFAGVGVAVYLFLGVKTGSLVEAGTPRGTPPSPVPRAEMARVLERYGERLINYESGNLPTYDLFDPHLTLKPKK